MSPRSAHEIVHALWVNVAVTQALLTLSEVLGHIDLLLDRGAIVETEADGVVLVGEVEIILVALLVAVAVPSAAARAINVPDPIVLVIGGAIMGLAPIGLPEVELDPDLVR